MNLSSMMVTLILVSAFMGGMFIYAGNLFAVTNTSDTLTGQFANANASSMSIINKSKDIYKTSQELEPFTADQSGGYGSLAKGFWSSMSIIANSLSAIPTLIADLGRNLMIPAQLMYAVMTAVVVVVVLTIYKALRGGMIDI